MAIGKSVSMLDARERVTGRVGYIVNMHMPGMLTARVFRSQEANARITRLDTSAAERVPGVVTVATAADLDQPGGPARMYGRMVKDHQVLCKERVRYVGDPVALVAAESAEAAEEALGLIDVEYEDLGGGYDPMSAKEEGAPVVQEDLFQSNQYIHGKLRHGDVDAGFAEADEVVEEIFTSPVAQQTSLEPHACVALWEEGKLTLWTASQSPWQVRQTLADIFKMDPGDIRVVVPPLGGGYGGKGGTRIEHLAATLAWKAPGRPVKLVFSRHEEFATVTKHAATLTVKTGIKRDGTLTARKIAIYWGTGAYSDASPALVRGALVRAVGPYRIPNVWVDSIGVYTNLPPAAAYRGAMSSQCTWMYESHTDSLARAIGMDPLELRRKNLLRDHEHFATGEEMHDLHFVECLEACVERLGWDSPLEQPGGPLRRGRGLAVMMKSTSPTTRSECKVELDDEGGLTVYTSTVEMGQGTHTALAQIAAEASGVDFERVRVVGPDTAITPFDTATNASRGTNMMGTALLDACANLRQRIGEVAGPVLDLPPEQVQVKDGVVSGPGGSPSLSYAEVLRRAGMGSLEAMGEHATKAGLDPETGQGIGSPHYHQGAGACEVEVDVETGKVRVLRYASASYAGRLVNPDFAGMQNDGNVVYGMGPAMMEEVVFDEGQPVNANMADYMIPSFRDIPEWMKSDTLESEGAEFHGIGEMTLPPVAPAIANAIFNATGARIYDLPMTPERVLRGLLHE